MRYLITIICLVFFYQCAAFNKKNTPLLVKVEEKIVPKKQPQKILLAPFYLPVGMVAGILDVFIGHPIRQIPVAYNDTKESLWNINFNGYVTEMGTLPVRIVLSPIILGIDWLGRSAFDIDHPGSYSTTSSETEEEWELSKMIELKDYSKIYNYYTSCQIKNDKDFNLSFEFYKEQIKSTDASGDYSVYISNCLCYNYLEKSEDFLLSNLQRSDKDYALLSCFESKKSEKASAKLLYILQTEDLSDTTVGSYINSIIRIGNEREIREIKNRLKK